MRFIKDKNTLVRTTLPIIIAVILFLLQARQWVFPKQISTSEFAATSVNATSQSQSSGSGFPAADYIAFDLRTLELIGGKENDDRGVQIFLIFRDAEKAPFGYHYPFGDDVFRVEPSSTISLGKYGGWADVNSIGDELDIQIIVVRSDLGTKQVLDDVFQLLGNIAGAAIKLTDLWNIVLGQATQMGSDTLVAYLQDAEPIGSFNVSLRRDSNWQIGRQTTVLSEDGAFEITYVVVSSSEPTVISEPVVVTATPIYVVLTPTPLFTSTSSITLLSLDRAQNNLDGQELVRVPSGEFLMGLTQEQIDFLYRYCDKCSTNVFEYSKPVHKIFLDEYWIYKTEVTVGEYKLCVKSGYCKAPHEIRSSTITDYYDNPREVDSPVINVDWDMSNAYCAWAGGRLPTEAEWEKAARGTDGRLFPWGDNLPNHNLANVKPSDSDVVYVGKYESGASPYGALDMAGNVYEWVSDWYHEYFYQTVLASLPNPKGPDNFDGTLYSKVVRGGSWFYEDVIATSGFHDFFEKDKYGTGVGFRCVVDSH